MANEMKVGDIGVLQHIGPLYKNANGTIAEITGLAYDAWPGHDYTIKTPLFISSSSGGEWSIKKHEIRPITDPGEQEETEEEIELVV